MKTHLSKGILVAENDPLSREYVAITLEHLKIDFRLAKNGQEAVSLAKEKDFDFILMDLNVSGMDGFDASRAIRKFNPNIPIVAYSPFASRNDKLRVLDSGMNDYIPKSKALYLLRDMVKLFNIGLPWMQKQAKNPISHSAA